VKEGMNEYPLLLMEWKWYLIRFGHEYLKKKKIYLYMLWKVVQEMRSMFLWMKECLS
jgi:hypothetical protein